MQLKLLLSLFWLMFPLPCGCYAIVSSRSSLALLQDSFPNFFDPYTFLLLLCRKRPYRAWYRCDIDTSGTLISWNWVLLGLYRIKLGLVGGNLINTYFLTALLVNKICRYVRRIFFDFAFCTRVKFPTLCLWYRIQGRSSTFAFCQKFSNSSFGAARKRYNWETNKDSRVPEKTSLPSKSVFPQRISDNIRKPLICSQVSLSWVMLSADYALCEAFR